MKNFVIRDLEHLSGIKAHTLRVWEQRFDFIKPYRTKTNFRQYSIDEIQQLLNIALLTRNGYKISKLSSLNHEEINLKLNGLACEEDQHQRAVNDLVVSMYKMNTEIFEATIDYCLREWSADIVLKNVILEFLNKTGLKWQGNKQTEEHVPITIIRKKITSAIDQLKTNECREKSVLLFLPDSKQLDIILLYTHFLLRSKGFKVLYMGMDVTISNLKIMLEIKQPDAAITYLHNKSVNVYNEISTWITDQNLQTRMFIIPFPNDEIAYTKKNISVMPLENIMDTLIDY
jgi:DNA-binding transcriptional MerR regulator